MISMSSQLVPMPSSQFTPSTENAFTPPARYVRFGSFHLDLRKEELLKDGARVRLQNKVYQALLALLEKPGEVVTREALRMRLWPSDTHVNYDANVNTTVNKLRQVLGDSPDQPTFVDTIPRKGYSFVAKIEYLDQPVIRQAPRPGELSPGTTPGTTFAEREQSRGSFFRTAVLSTWFTATVVVLVIASMLFGAALVLYAHH